MSDASIGISSLAHNAIYLPRAMNGSDRVIPTCTTTFLEIHRPAWSKDSDVKNWAENSDPENALRLQRDSSRYAED